ncbi:IS701 family transposase [Thiobacillus sp.]
MGLSLESRFEAYCDELVKALSHADRSQPARWYLKGLMLPGSRKSVEPMAARVRPHDVRSAHQSMHHLVADAEWSDDALLATVAGLVLPSLTAGTGAITWIVDDTGFPKKGTHSVGVARQYCGQVGKTDNCRVAVSLSLGTAAGSLPLSYRLYLPREWTDDAERCRAAGVPEATLFATKNEIARAQIEAALQAGIPRGTVLGDAAYGDDTALRDWLTEQELIYALGVRTGTTVWWGEHQPVAAPIIGKRGKTKTHLTRDEHHQPISVLTLARTLAPQRFRSVTWRQGTSEPLRSRFARVRVRAAHRDVPREEEWLVIEWPKGEAEPSRYWLSTHSQDMPFAALVESIKARWRIERDYQELKQEFGLGHYEGRNWRGFHHHASLCIAAYGFLMRERLSGAKKNAGQFAEPALPEGFRPRGATTDATPRPEFDPHIALPPRSCHRKRLAAMSMLREISKSGHECLITQ